MIDNDSESGGSEHHVCQLRVQWKRRPVDGNRSEEQQQQPPAHERAYYDVAGRSTGRSVKQPLSPFRDFVGRITTHRYFFRFADFFFVALRPFFAALFALLFAGFARLAALAFLAGFAFAVFFAARACFAGAAFLAGAAVFAAGFNEWTANMAPCGSIPCAIQSPPGTSIGPLTILPPPACAMAAAAFASATLM